MRIPLINSDPELMELLRKLFDESNQQQEGIGQAAQGFSAGMDTSGYTRFNPVPLSEAAQVMEYVSYQMPPLMIVNFSDEKLDGFDLIEQITGDSWMNHGSIIAIHNNHETFNRLETLDKANILISLDSSTVKSLIPKLLDIMRTHSRILFQRHIQVDLLHQMTGHFLVDMDMFLVPCYSNMIANYLHNVGYIGHDAKSNVALVLTEMLHNAIEHGNCGITSENKSAHLAKGLTIHSLIQEMCREDVMIAKKKVFFGYTISPAQSVYVIRDEGQGFSWQEYLSGDREMDYLAEHGRGIMLAQQAVDSLGYNEVGNEVTLEFRHQKSSANLVPSAFKDHETLVCKTDDVIFNEGEESSFLYYVAEGEYRVEVNGQHVANITPEDILMGEMSFLLEETRSASVTATKPGKLIKISKEDFITILKNQPYYGLFLSKLLAQRLFRLNRGMLS